MEKNYIAENRIREALKIRGMRQVELCEKTGINKSSLNHWLAQHWQPKQKALHKMAIALNVSELWLAGYDIPMERPLEQIKSDELAELIHLIRKNDNLQELFISISKLNAEQVNSIELIVKQFTVINSQQS